MLIIDDSLKGSLQVTNVGEIDRPLAHLALHLTLTLAPLALGILARELSLLPKKLGITFAALLLLALKIF